MKTPITKFLGLASMLLMFSACQKDSLVDNVTPQYSTDVASELRSSEIAQFELWTRLDIVQPDCNDRIMTRDTEDKIDEITKTSGCTGLYGLSGDEGQGFIAGYGRFLTDIVLKFDADNNRVSGTVELTLRPSGDMLVLKAYGEIIKESTDEGTTMMVHVRFIKGTGVFEHVDFYGELTIMEADKIFDGHSTEYYATIYITGDFAH